MATGKSDKYVTVAEMRARREQRGPMHVAAEAMSDLAPPVDNDHIAPDSERFDETTDLAAPPSLDIPESVVVDAPVHKASISIGEIQDIARDAALDRLARAVDSVASLDIPDFAKLEDFQIPDGGREAIDDIGAGIDDIDEDEYDGGPVSAAKLAAHMEKAPAHVIIPETVLPLHTVIEKTPTGFMFKVPGQQPIHGHGRSVGGAMLDAKIIR